MVTCPTAAPGFSTTSTSPDNASSSTADNGQPNIYGIDPVQFYGEAGNVLFSHAYTFLDNPYTQTGVLASLQITEE